MTDAEKQEDEKSAESAAVEKPAVTGRPNDIAPGSLVGNTTFAERAAAAKKAASKAVQAEQDGAENKAVQQASTKRKRK